jgi:hypothetical protein
VLQLAARIVALSNYLVDADPDKLQELQKVSSLLHHPYDGERAGIVPGEKVLGFGSRYFDGEMLADWQIEMIAVAASAPRSADPIEHVVLSFRSGESPSPEQSEEAVDLFLRVVGAAECQAIWSLHGNTDNAHIHLLLNRVDPMSRRATSLGAGWDLDAMHRAVAVIEAQQGWQPERNSRYLVVDQKLVRRGSGEVLASFADYGVAPGTPTSSGIEAADPVRDEPPISLRSSARLVDETIEDENTAQSSKLPGAMAAPISAQTVAERHSESDTFPALRSSARMFEDDDDRDPEPREASTTSLNEQEIKALPASFDARLNSEEASATWAQSRPNRTTGDKKAELRTPGLAEEDHAFSLRSSARIPDAEEAEMIGSGTATDNQPASMSARSKAPTQQDHDHAQGSPEGQKPEGEEQIKRLQLQLARLRDSQSL